MSKRERVRIDHYILVALRLDDTYQLVLSFRQNKTTVGMHDAAEVMIYTIAQPHHEKTTAAWSNTSGDDELTMRIQLPNNLLQSAAKP